MAQSTAPPPPAPPPPLHSPSKSSDRRILLGSFCFGSCFKFYETKMIKSSGKGLELSTRDVLKQQRQQQMEEFERKQRQNKR